jgi:hypothetical protein
MPSAGTAALVSPKEQVPNAQVLESAEPPLPSQLCIKRALCLFVGS